MTIFRKKTVAILLISSQICCSCGTLFWGKTKRVDFVTYPTGAKVYLNGMPTDCTTPCSLLLKRKGQEPHKTRYYVTLKRDGYEDGQFTLKREIDYTPLALDALGIYLALVTIPLDLIMGSAFTFNDTYPLHLEPKPVIETPKIIYQSVAEEKPLVVPNIIPNTIKTNETPIGYTFEKKSDVDTLLTTNIPKNSNRIALIIGNEDYHSFQEGLTSENDVKFALNDASAFKEYALNYLGIPEERIIFSLNATSGRMKQNISKVNLLIKNLGSDAEVFVYYAGHGFPDEVTKESYLIPVDISAKEPQNGGISLKEFYAKLSEFPAKKVTVFLDACFSGGARNQGLLAARGVRIKPTESTLSGNMVVFAASSGEQSALPFTNRHHGMFTYFLLKKIKETNATTNYNDLYKYIKKNVGVESVSYNDKEQNPQINISPELQNKWENLPLILK